MHPAYAASLEEFGTPLELPFCGGWILKRQIPGFPYHDATGCYPLFACRDWSKLPSDLDAMQKQLVAVSLVTDPFGKFSPDFLQRHFDLVRPFKEHFITDLRYPISKIVRKDHRQAALSSFRKGVEVERVQDPMKHVDTWASLYDVLIEKHRISGIRTFSRNAFAKQFSTPGFLMFRAIHKDVTIGASLVYVDRETAYNHLTASSQAGYKLKAPCALNWYKIEYFAKRLRWLELGAGAGVENDPTDGLSKFKMGWSTGTRTVYFCGRILDDIKYKKIINTLRNEPTNYFPAYRRHEF